MRHLGLGLALVLLGAAAHVAAFDRVGDGEEPELPLPAPLVTPSVPAAPLLAPLPPASAPMPEPVTAVTPIPPLRAPMESATDPVTPLVPMTPPAPVTPAGGGAGVPARPPTGEEARGSPPSAPVTPPAPAGVTPPAAPEADLTADRPGVTEVKPRSPFQVDLEDFPPEDGLNTKAQKALQAVADLKKAVLQVSADLDAGGRERTRLIFGAETLGGLVSTLAALWPEDPVYRDACASAKRSALVLEEELRNEPRRWSHVRWAFQEVQQQIKTFRRTAADHAASEPKLIRIVKKGQESYVEPPKDAATLRREEEERKRRELRQEKERLQKEQERPDSKAKSSE